MIEHRDGIEGSGFPRGPSGIVDNPLSSQRRGKPAAGRLPCYATPCRPAAEGQPGCWEGGRWSITDHGRKGRRERKGEPERQRDTRKKFGEENGKER